MQSFILVISCWTILHGRVEVKSDEMDIINDEGFANYKTVFNSVSENILTLDVEWLLFFFIFKKGIMVCEWNESSLTIRNDRCHQKVYIINGLEENHLSNYLGDGNNWFEQGQLYNYTN